MVWVCAALVVVAGAGLCRADVVRWINPAGGEFGVGANWDRGTPPGVADVATFELTEPYTVVIGEDIQLWGMSISGDGLTLVMTDREVTLGQVSNQSGFGLMVSGAVTFQGGDMTMGGGDVTIVGGPFIATDWVLSDKGVGGGYDTSSDISGVVQMTNSGIVTQTVLLRAHTTATASWFSGEFTNLGNAQLIGGHFGSSEGTYISGPAHISGGAIVRRGDFRGQLTIGGSVVVEGSGTELVDPRITGGVTRIRSGGGIRGLVNVLGRIVYEDGTVGPNSFVAVLSSGSARFEPGSQGPASVQFWGDSSVRHEFLIDAMRPTLVLAKQVPNFAVALNGSFVVDVAHPNALRVGQEWTLLESTVSFTGAFSQVITPPLPGGRVLLVVIEGPRVIARVVAGGSPCWTADINGDGVVGDDADIEAFFLCLGGNCCPACAPADFNGDGAHGLDDDIASFFLVLGGGACV